MINQSSEELTNENKRLYERCRDDLLKRQLSNAENFDKAVLTYSSVGLSLSLTFIKDFISIEHADYRWLLFLSWWAFVVVIVMTIISYIIGQRAVTKQLELADRYYLKNELDAYNERPLSAKLIDWISIGSGIFFVVAVVFTTCFVTLNLHGDKTMTQKEIRNASSIPQMQRIMRVQDAAPIPNKMERQAAPIPTMEAKPVESTSGSTAQTPAQPSGGNQSSTSQTNGGTSN